MTRDEMIECRDNLLDSIEFFRRRKPSIWFEIRPVEWSEGNFHVEVLAKKVNAMGTGRSATDLMTLSWPKGVIMERVLSMARKIGEKELEEIKKDFLDELS